MNATCLLNRLMPPRRRRDDSDEPQSLRSCGSFLEDPVVGDRSPGWLTMGRFSRWKRSSGFALLRLRWASLRESAGAETLGQRIIRQSPKGGRENLERTKQMGNMAVNENH